MHQQNSIHNTGDNNLIIQGNEGCYIVVNQVTQQRHFVPKVLTLLPRPALVLGRDEVIADIHAAFQHRPETLLVNGVGGIGKTTVALHYLHHYFNEYTHLAYVEVGQSIRSALAANADLRDNLGLKDAFEKIAPDQYEQEASRLVLNGLNILPGPVLLVLDNANDAADLAAMRPFLSATQCRVLFTSRADLDDAHVIRIEELPPALAAQLFAHHCPFPEDDRDTVDAILKKIHYHTLLIELIAKTARRNGMALSALLQLLEEGFLRHPDLNRRLVPTGQHGQRLQGDRPREAKPLDYLHLLFREIGQLDEEAQQALRLCSLLPSQDYTEEQLLDFFKIPEENREAFAQTLDRLTQGGWLTRRDAQPPTWKLHALLQEVVKDELRPDGENCEELIIRLAEILNINYSIDNPVTKFQWLPYGVFAFERLESKEHLPVATLLYQISCIYKELGLYPKAKFFGEQAVELAEKCLGAANKVVAAFSSIVGHIYTMMGLYSEAVTIYKRALNIGIETLGHEHPDVAIYKTSLASAYVYLGRNKEAMPLLEAALESDLKNFGKDHPQIAITKQHIAYIHDNLGQYKEAGNVLESVLRIKLKNFGEDHPGIAVTLSDLGNINFKLGEFEKALDLYKRALEKDIRSFGSDHPAIAIRKTGIGMVYKNLGRFEEAVSLLKEALTIDLKNFEVDHPNIASTKSNLALILSDLKRYEEAIELLESALEIDKKNFGDNHRLPAIRYNNLGKIYLNMGKPREAIPFFNKAMDIFQQIFPADHPNVIQVSKNLTDATRLLSTP